MFMSLKDLDFIDTCNVEAEPIALEDDHSINILKFVRLVKFTMASVFPPQKPTVPLSEANAEAWSGILDKYYDALDDASSQGTTASQDRHRGRGQLLGMSRPKQVLDPTIVLTMRNCSRNSTRSG